MKNIQIILNAVLSKNIFEYIIIDKNFHIVNLSDGIASFVDTMPKIGGDVVDVCPEFVGSEEEIRKIFTHPEFTYLLESVHKSKYYLNISIEYYDEGAALVLFHNITDVTLTRQQVLQYSNESLLLTSTLQKILNRQNAFLFVTNNNEISFANQQFLEYFGVEDIENLRRKNLHLYQYLDASLNSYDSLFKHVNSKEEYVIINDDTFILQATIIESTHKLFTLTKVTNLSHEVYIDTLTGAYRKIYFNKQLEEMIKNKKEGTVVVIDIDDFKNVNDTHGHLIGDDVLKEFATLIKNNIRENDIFARWGGEEFLLLLEGTALKNTITKIEKLRKIIDNHTFDSIGNLTASFGIAKKEENDDLHSLLQRADKALYEAKTSGKNKLVFKKVEKADK